MVRKKSVVDEGLAWGESTTPPGEVLRESKKRPWHENLRFKYGTERLVPEGDSGESIYDIEGAEIPLRAMIVHRLIEFYSMETPWKSWVESTRGNGWLVVEDTGWRFHPQDSR